MAGEAEFVVERRAGANGAWQPAGMTAISVLTFQDSGFVSGSAYSYRVAARNGAITSAYSNEVTILLAAPVAPEGLMATKSGAQQITVDWTDTANENGYELDRKTGAAGAWSPLITLDANQTRYVNGNLTPGTEYFYRIRATNAFGPSPNSAEASATTDQTPPTAPGFLTAAAVNAFTVNLSWGNSSYEDEFVIERRIGSTGAWGELARRAANASSYTDTTAQPLTGYQYRVKASNTVGESAYSSVASVTTPQITPPPPPNGLVARPASATEVLITWSDVSSETAYLLQRRGDDPNSWADLATLDTDATSYRDVNLSTGNAVTFIVWRRATLQAHRPFPTSTTLDRSCWFAGSKTTSMPASVRCGAAFQPARW